MTKTLPTRRHPRRIPEQDTLILHTDALVLPSASFTGSMAAWVAPRPHWRNVITWLLFGQEPWQSIPETKLYCPQSTIQTKVLAKTRFQPGWLCDQRHIDLFCPTCRRNIVITMTYPKRAQGPTLQDFIVWNRQLHGATR